jgi:hypothetical protein
MVASVFGDDRWDLTSAVFEAHAAAISLNWLAVPDPFRQPLKQHGHAPPTLLQIRTQFAVPRVCSHHRSAGVHPYSVDKEPRKTQVLIALSPHYRGLQAIRSARSEARDCAWSLGGEMPRTPTARPAITH